MESYAYKTMCRLIVSVLIAGTLIGCGEAPRVGAKFTDRTNELYPDLVYSVVEKRVFSKEGLAERAAQYAQEKRMLEERHSRTLRENQAMFQGHPDARAAESRAYARDTFALQRTSTDGCIADQPCISLSAFGNLNMNELAGEEVDAGLWIDIRVFRKRFVPVP